MVEMDGGNGWWKWMVEMDGGNALSGRCFRGGRFPGALPQAELCQPFGLCCPVIRHSSFVIRHSSFVIWNLEFGIWNLPFDTQPQLTTPNPAHLHPNPARRAKTT